MQTICINIHKYIYKLDFNLLIKLFYSQYNNIIKIFK